MKRVLLIAAAVVVVIAAGVLMVTGRLTFMSGRQATAQTIEEAPEPKIAPAADAVTEGMVVPAQHAALSMAAGGIVAEILIREDRAVEAGQVILRLENAHQQAAVAQAEAGLAAAQARLAALRAGPRAEEIASAEANLEAAQAGLARLQEGARPSEIAAAQAALEAAQAALQRLDDGPDDHTRIAAEAELANAEAALRQAQAAYDRVAGQADVAMRPESLQLEQATNQYNAAKARYEALFAPPDADAVTQAQAEVKQAQAHLDRLRAPATVHEIAEAEAGVRQAQAQLELVKSGTRAEEIAAAVAAVAEAEAAVQQARAGLADTELRAPFAGTVAALYVREGESVTPGSPSVQLADLTAWQVETDDLTELDIGRVQVGDRAVLAFDAIPGVELLGQVVRIKAIGEEKRGDMTYTLIIEPQEQHPGFRWNMTALVRIP